MTTITGLPDLREALLSIPEKLRKRALRNALAAGARVVRDDAKKNAPVLALSAARKAPYRKAGTLKKAIAVRTSKVARRAGDVGVFVNVKPAKGAARGAKNPNDPFYFRWQEWGWTPATGKRNAANRRARRKAVKSGANSAIPGKHFLTNAAGKLGEALNVFIAKIGPQIQKLNGGKDVTL